MARPRLKVDVEKLRTCAERQWTDRELAAFFSISIDTLHRRFADLVDTARDTGKAKLKDLILRRALEGSDRMLVHAANRFLGKIPDVIDLRSTNLNTNVNTEVAEEKVSAAMERLEKKLRGE